MTLYRRQGSRPSTWKRNAKKSKWLSGEALQIAVKGRKAKSKGENERYKHLNAEFQRIARDKKDFLSNQCKEIEENNRMGKIRDLFKKIRDIKGIFHAKMDTIKYRNSKDPTEAEEIKKRWQEYTKELYKKGLNDSDNHDVVVTHLKPDILQCEGQWALGSMAMNKASGGDGNPVELLQILKDDESAALNIPANLENSAVATGISFPSQRKAMPKNVQLPHNCTRFTC